MPPSGHGNKLRHTCASEHARSVFIEEKYTQQVDRDLRDTRQERYGEIVISGATAEGIFTYACKHEASAAFIEIVELSTWLIQDVHVYAREYSIVLEALADYHIWIWHFFIYDWITK
jgi:hypothetical protein